MRIRLFGTVLFVVLLHWLPLAASGPVGIYGIVEKVVFEPDEARAERVQVWGAFAYVDGGAASSLAVSGIERGYLYFRLPDGSVAGADAQRLVRREWTDLKAVAGTGQVVGFGSWGYIGAFQGLKPGVRSNMPPYVLERAPAGGSQTDLRVHPASEPPSSPAAYQTDAGVVKISADGNRADLVKRLREAVRK